MILEEIVRHKEKELALIRRKGGVFYSALKKASGVAIIAEIKKKSPSKGILRKDFNPEVIARSFEAGGASALSVLTDAKFFGGSAEILRRVRAVTRLPILRKDFILDPSQVYESAAMGADAILLIAAILSPSKLRSLSGVAASLGLDVLFEVHDKAELGKVLPLKPRLLGINNRDLKTFRVDLAVTERLASLVSKEALLVSESGIWDFKDIQRVKRCGAKAVLVGESLMKQKNPKEALQKLRGKGYHGSS